MSMELLEVGSQCSHSSCGEIDFLPVLCRCSKYFCRHHIAPDIHSCSIGPLTIPSTAPFHKLQRCAIDVCSKPTLHAFHSNDTNIEATCSQCRKSFCADHRHPKSHTCQIVDAPRSQKTTSARTLLAKHFPPSSKKAASRRAVRIPTDSAQLAHHRRVELMKLRHRAVPGNPMDSLHTCQDHRVHLRLQVDEQTEKVFWFCKSTVTGKVLDCLAFHAGLRSSLSTPLQLCVVREQCALVNDQAIGDIIEDGELLVVARLG